MRATVAHALRSEWTKFRTLPSNLTTLLIAVLLMTGPGTLTAYRAGEGYRGGVFDATGISMYGGFLFAQIAVGALGVVVMTSEYATGMIRTSLSVVPRRGRLLSAKVALFGGVALVAGEVAAFVTFLLGQSAIAAGGAPSVTLGQPGVLRAVAGMGLVWALVGLTGVALGCLLRDGMTAVTVLVAVNFIIPIIGPRLLPESAGDLVTTYWPISAGLQVITTVQDPGRLAPWAGLGVLAGCTAVLLAAAFALFRWRDA
ncbi:ABC transporter permease [Nonomuraea zeae]|uniref:ABC transporter permease n=1 Tax=Nonomuraea zeae TaxID=1642303 RepID=A0A5S4GA22_9ACTN|nr:ABC transporter permease [Nonomuraea zeae]TMR29858.1 ABC transporter permease [Nonomuraea zeae]